MSASLAFALSGTDHWHTSFQSGCADSTVHPRWNATSASFIDSARPTRARSPKRCVPVYRAVQGCFGGGGFEVERFVLLQWSRRCNRRANGANRTRWADRGFGFWGVAHAAISAAAQAAKIRIMARRGERKSGAESQSWCGWFSKCCWRSASPSLSFVDISKGKKGRQDTNKDQ